MKTARCKMEEEKKTTVLVYEEHSHHVLDEHNLLQLRRSRILIGQFDSRREADRKVKHLRRYRNAGYIICEIQ